MTRQTASVVLTPPGRGAVATVLVEGPQATDVVGKCFQSAAGKPLAEIALGRIVFGKWGGPQGEELVVCRRSEQTIEVHCHGGQAAVVALVESLDAAGCRSVAWQAWFRSRAGLIQSQALEALALAATERTASILLDQYAGALQSAVESILGWLQPGDNESRDAARRLLETLHQRRCRTAADRTLPGRAGRQPERRQKQLDQRLGRLSAIDRLRSAGHHARRRDDADGAGRLARATGRHRRAETCRRRVGSRRRTRARATLAGADIQVLVFDSTAPWSEADEALRADWPDALIVHNKADLLRPQDCQTTFVQRACQRAPRN